MSHVDGLASVPLPIVEWYYQVSSIDGFNTSRHTYKDTGLRKRRWMHGMPQASVNRGPVENVRILCMSR